MEMMSQFFHMTWSSFFLWHCFVSLVKFSCWSKFHVNIITGSGVMRISFYKGLTTNQGIGNTSVWILPTIWRLVQVRSTKFGTNVSNKMLLNEAKCQGYIFCSFWVIKGQPTEGKTTPSAIRINATISLDSSCWFVFDACLIGDLHLLFEFFQVKDWNVCCSVVLSPVRFVFWLILLEVIFALFYKFLPCICWLRRVLYCCGFWRFFISLSIMSVL